MAKESKFAGEAVGSIVSALEAGKSDRDAASAAGIHFTTYYRWERRGRKGHEPFAAFVAQCDAARDRCQARRSEALRRVLAPLHAAS